MTEIDLMDRYPKSERSALVEERAAVTEEDRRIAQQFGREYFDGERRMGLGGYHYDQKYFKPVVERFIEYYGLSPKSRILDVGCAKGFMLHDFAQALPGVTLRGVDISRYCLDNAMESVAENLSYASCDNLPFDDDSFDLVISIATVHNLDVEGVKKSLREIMRVSTGKAFIKVNGYRTDQERDQLEKWNLVAKTILHVDAWKELFAEIGYTGDYYWFRP